MGSMRVHELAKEFGLSSKEMLDKLAEMKIPAKNHASTLVDAYVDKVRKQLGPEMAERAARIEREAQEAAAAEAAKAEAERLRIQEEQRLAAEEERRRRQEEKAGGDEIDVDADLLADGESDTVRRREEALAKKLEAMRRTVRSDVDFVITFEELQAMFDAKDIHLEEYEAESSLHDATGAGRGYGVAGGVASAIESVIREYYPDVEVNIEHAESLAECKKVLMLAKVGKKNGCLIEGMACPGGCVAGAGTCIGIPQATKAVNTFKAESDVKIPSMDAMKQEEIE